MMSNLRYRRRLAGLTQIRTARRSGVERSRLSLAECGHVELSVEELEAVNGVLRSEIRARAEEYQRALHVEAL